MLERDAIQMPQCIPCSKVFRNGCIKPSKLREHLQNVHHETVEDTRTSKLNKLGLKGEVHLKFRFCRRKETTVRSYRVAVLIATEKKPHTIAKTLETVCCGNDTKQKIAHIPLSNDTIHNRIEEMSQDIRLQVVEQIKVSPGKISLQLDGTTDVSNCGQHHFGRDV